MELKTKLSPLYLLNDKCLVAYRNAKIFLVDISNGKIISKSALPNFSISEKIIARFGLAARAFRLYPRAVCLNGKHLFFGIKNRCYIFDIETEKVVCLCRFSNQSSGPLYFAKYKKGIIYGEYFNNSEKRPVSIFYIDSTLEVPTEIIKIHGIRHIHGIFSGPSINTFFVACGDDGEESQIGLLDLNSDATYSQIVFGKQIYRTCFISQFKNKICYATDSPFERNNIFVHNQKNTRNGKEVMFPIEGSVIFGCNLVDYCVFSSCVETNLAKDSYGKNKRIPIDGRNGGILSKNAVIYCLSKKTGKVTILDSGKKDFLNIHYFGFGTFHFCQSNNPNQLIYYSRTIARKKNKLFFLDLNKLVD